MIKAIYNNVVLQKKDSSTINGIYIPTSTTNTYQVISVGETVKTIKVGNFVILKDNPQLYKENNNEYYIIDASNILAIVEE